MRLKTIRLKWRNARLHHVIYYSLKIDRNYFITYKKFINKGSKSSGYSACQIYDVLPINNEIPKKKRLF